MIVLWSRWKCRQLLAVGLISPIVFSASLPPDNQNLPPALKEGHIIFQLGGYFSIQGEQQHINIRSLIGDEFTVTNNHSNNGLVGLGYFLDGQEKDLFKMTYGINVFYLAKTSVSGEVVQENFFTNLSYHYHVNHYPVYAIAKTTLKTNSSNYALTVDAGLGPNFITTSGFKERSLDNGITIPDDIFRGHISATFSATTGLGLKLNHFFAKAPFECGYRFFYLGQGNFRKNTRQLLNTLKTGNNYANAVMCSVTI